MESVSKSSKSHRVRDLLPSVRPSYLSLILVFVCEFLLLRNESTNDRLLALEKQMNILSSSQSFFETGSKAKPDEISDKAMVDSVVRERKIEIPVVKRIRYPSGKVDEES